MEHWEIIPSNKSQDKRDTVVPERSYYNIVLHNKKSIKNILVQNIASYFSWVLQQSEAPTLLINVTPTRRYYCNTRLKKQIFYVGCLLLKLAYCDVLKQRSMIWSSCHLRNVTFRQKDVSGPWNNLHCSYPSWKRLKQRGLAEIGLFKAFIVGLMLNFSLQYKNFISA